MAARKLAVADLVAGAPAGMVLVVGLLRVFFFEKGAAYYFHSVPFLAKLSLFATIALLSIIHLELVAIVLLLLNAVLTAKGIG